MYEQLKMFLGGKVSRDNISDQNDHDLHLAAAALLLEAAFSDGNYTSDEQGRIRILLQTHFNLTEIETNNLIIEAEKVVDKSVQLYGFTRIVKDKYNQEERINIIEMLWEVCFSDGKADKYETNLIQRVAGLIFVSDRERGLARKRVMARLGIVS